MENLSEAAIYVGTYAKYNNGSLEGKWVELSNFLDREDFYNFCEELHKDEEDPEYMFQDWENIPEEFISESWLSEKFFDLRDALDNLDVSNKNAFLVWAENSNQSFAEESIDDMISSFADKFIGEYSSEVQFATELVQEIYDLPEIALNYFDYESFSKDLFSSDYWFEDGFVFSNS